MICRKCRVAFNEFEGECPYCGVKTRHRKKLRIIFGVFALAVVLTACFLFLYTRPDFFPKPAVTPPRPELITEQPGEPGPEGEPGEPPGETAPPDIPGEDMFKALAEIYSAATAYREKFSVYAEFVSRGGYLYDMSSGDYVRISDLCDTDMLNKKYENEPVFLLFMRPADFSELGGAEFGGGMGLRLFAASETASGEIAVYGAGAAVTLYRENYAQILEKYAFNHGEITRPGRESFEYAEIEEAILGYSLFSPGIFINHLAFDEKYACAAVSLKSDQSRVFQLILRRGGDGSSFEIAAQNSYNYSFGYDTINGRLPDLNLELLPLLNFDKFKDTLTDDYSAFAGALSAMEFISEDELPPDYFMAADNFAYMKTAGGRLFLGVIDSLGEGGGWDVIPCESWADARAVMLDMDKNPPLLILLQE